MIWVKALHVAFMVAWFAGIFYLPRLFVNLAMTKDAAVEKQLLIMARKLYRFITPWMVLTLVFGIWLLIDYGWQAYAQTWWLGLKLGLIVALIFYHFYCGRLLRQFEQQSNQHSHIWFRWFNELPVLLLFSIIILVVVKPF
ncbi:MAG: putative membrane protein [Gammaproteobacteria bacterium]|jgi:putative membrane protein